MLGAHVTLDVALVLDVGWLEAGHLGGLVGDGVVAVRSYAVDRERREEHEAEQDPRDAHLLVGRGRRRSAGSAGRTTLFPLLGDALCLLVDVGDVLGGLCVKVVDLGVVCESVVVLAELGPDQVGLGLDLGLVKHGLSALLS